MENVNTILTLADLSSASLNVLEASCLCATRLKGELIIYHASPNLIGESQVEQLQADFKRRIDDICRSLGISSLKFKVLVAQEDFPNGQMLRQLLTDADLVVLGGGRAGTSDVKREKVVKVLDHCDQPLMVIPNEKRLPIVNHILFCSSYKELTEDKPLSFVKNLAENFGADVRVAHVKTHSGSPNEDSVERSRYEGSFFEPEVKYSYKLIRSDDVIDGITDYIKKKGDNDLLVMIRRKHHIFDRLFGKNFTYRMLQHTEIPFLILKEAQLN